MIKLIKRYIILIIVLNACKIKSKYYAIKTLNNNIIDFEILPSNKECLFSNTINNSIITFNFKNNKDFILKNYFKIQGVNIPIEIKNLVIRFLGKSKEILLLKTSKINKKKFN